MKQMAINYGKVLFLLGTERQDVSDAREAWESCAPLRKVLCSPVVTKSQKFRTIEKVFPESMHAFLKVVTEYQELALLSDIFQAYGKWYDVNQGISRGTLYYVDKPEKEQLDQIQKKLCSQLQCKEVVLSLQHNPQLIGGFVIRIGDREIDQSLLGGVKGLKEKLTRR